MSWIYLTFLTHKGSMIFNKNLASGYGLILQDPHVLLIGNMSATHGFKVRGLELAVYEFPTYLGKSLSQGDQGDLRGAWGFGKHTFSKERTTEEYPV